MVTWGQFGDHLYHKNLRGFKGNADVNEGIVSTIRNVPENFLYFNKGITILCSQLIKQPLGGKSRTSGVFECKGASVVHRKARSGKSKVRRVDHKPSPIRSM
jgi:hypothetical protein